MSAIGVQFNTAVGPAYFEPTVTQYLQKLEQAVNRRDVAAAQDAFKQLENAASNSALSSAGKAANEAFGRILSDLQDLGQALQSADLTKASQALDVLRRNLTQRPHAPQTRTEQPGHEESSVQPDPVGDSTSGQGSQVNLST